MDQKVWFYSSEKAFVSIFIFCENVLAYFRVLLEKKIFCEIFKQFLSKEPI